MTFKYLGTFVFNTCVELNHAILLRLQGTCVMP